MQSDNIETWFAVTLFVVFTATFAIMKLRELKKKDEAR